MTGRVLALIAVVALHPVASPAFGDDRLDDFILTVCADGCEFTSINDAIALVPEGGGIADYDIEIHDAVHREGAEIRTDGKNFTIVALGDPVKGDRAVIDGQSAHRIMRVESGSQVGVLGLAFENGVGSTNGGAILVTGSSLLACSRSDFRNNSGDPTISNSRGGAIYVNNSSASCSFSNCLFEYNAAARGGGIYGNAFDFFEISQSEFVGNESTDTSYADSIVNAIASNVLLRKTTLCGNGRQIEGQFSFQTSGDVTIANSCDTSSGIPGDLDDDGDYDEDDARIAMADFGITEGTPGDMDGDDDADVADFALLRNQIGVDNLGCTGSDINGDGTVDGADLAYILSFWGATCP
ncbi:MAG: hypothetical protein P8J88_03920 [Phycisphaerales bacterium]|nr:hypothetical protein [Phycisphaerales bacterium]